MENEHYLTETELSHLHYVVIYNQANLSNSSFLLFKKLQRYWETSWTDLYKQLKSPEILNPEDFLMQDKITALFSGEEIVGMHLLKNYKKEDFSRHRYFKTFDQKFFNQLQERGVEHLQSFQYFWVDPRWSRKKTGVNFGAIIASLSLKFQSIEELDASITVARKDIKVNETAEKLGFKELTSSSTMHNVPVALMACFNAEPYPEEAVVKWADFYWKNKIEHKPQNFRIGEVI